MNTDMNQTPDDSNTGPDPRPVPGPSASDATEKLPAQPLDDTRVLPAQPAPAPSEPAPEQPVPVGATPAGPPPGRGGKARWWIAGGAAAAIVLGVGGLSYSLGRAHTDSEAVGLTAVTLPHGGTPRGNAPGGDEGFRRGSGDGEGSPSDTPRRHSDNDTDDDGDTTRGGGTGHGTDRYDNKAEIDIEDQEGDGTSVEIKSVRTSIASGFVVITNADGDVLGWAPVSSGTQPVTVPLTERLTGTGKIELVGELWGDDGDSVFDPATDVRILEQDDHEDGIELISEDFDYWVR